MTQQQLTQHLMPSIRRNLSSVTVFILSLMEKSAGSKTKLGNQFDCMCFKMAIVNGHQIIIWQISYVLTAGLYQVPNWRQRVLWKCWLCNMQNLVDIASHSCCTNKTVHSRSICVNMIVVLYTFTRLHMTTRTLCGVNVLIGDYTCCLACCPHVNFNAMYLEGSAILESTCSSVYGGFSTAVL